MDARGIQRLLDKTYNLADTSPTVGVKTTNVILRDARVPDAVKEKLISLYGEESLRRTLNYAGLGLAICRVLESEAVDQTAREQLDFYRTSLQRIYETARAAFDNEFSGSHALEP